jgi:hypothetical protein
VIRLPLVCIRIESQRIRGKRFHRELLLKSRVFGKFPSPRGATGRGSYRKPRFSRDADFSLSEDYEQRRQRDYRRRKCKTDEEGTPDQSAVVRYNLRLSERHPRNNCDYGNRD